MLRSIVKNMLKRGIGFRMKIKQIYINIAILFLLVLSILPNISAKEFNTRSDKNVIKGGSKAVDLIQTADRVNDARRVASGTGNAIRGIDSGKNLKRAGDKIEYADPKTLYPSHTLNRGSGGAESLKNVENIKESIQKSGFDVNQPIEVATASGGQRIITQGHHRTQAAIEAGLNNVPVVEARPWNYPTKISSGRIANINELTDVARELAKYRGRNF